MLFSSEIIEELEKLDPHIRSAFLKILKLIEKAIGEVVKREDFLELKKEVERLANIVTELAEAQRKSEQRLTRIEQTIAELAEAQKRTEERLNELAEAQKRTEERLNELAEAQKRTEEELRQLIGEHKKTREQLGGLTHTVGYVLEDRAYKGLPELIKRDFALQTIDFIKRDYIEISPNRYEEINIFGKGRTDGKEKWILGECKTQLKKTDIDSFLNKIKKIESLLKGEKILITVTYQASPPVRQYAQEKGVKIYFSYEMPL
jgi:chromosome segregation ATPase